MNLPCKIFGHKYKFYPENLEKHFYIIRCEKCFCEPDMKYLSQFVRLARGSNGTKDKIRK